MRVILADDERNVRSAVKLLLEQEQNVEIVCETENLTGVIEKFSDLRPDLLLIDWDLRLPAMNRAMVMLLRHRCPGMRILAMSSLPESRDHALQSGVDAFVSKTDPPEVLIQSIRQVYSFSPRPYSYKR